MTFFYISDDFENEVRLCIRSWERQNPIIITGATIEGQIKEFVGTVQTIDRDAGRAEGKLWRVMIRELTPSSQAPVQRASSTLLSSLARYTKAPVLLRADAEMIELGEGGDHEWVDK
jgi:hypothetical protein